ncbi:hypothetical protein [Colwellia sp. 12G3]|nr:hypothetical protein [Colwellia sp. 12G3]
MKTSKKILHRATREELLSSFFSCRTLAEGAIVNAKGASSRTY